MPRIASVLLPMPLPEAFDYAEPEGLELAVGRVEDMQASYDAICAQIGLSPDALNS